MDFQLKEEQLAIRDLARKFAVTEMKNFAEVVSDRAWMTSR
jgi:hypothetical protein